MRITFGHIAQGEVPAVLDLLDVQPGAGRQQHRLAEPHRIPHRIRKVRFDIRQYRCSAEHSMRDDGWESEQLGPDRAGMDRVVVAAHRGVAANLSWTDP